MNEQLISEIVSPKANEQVNKLTADLAKTNAELQDTIIAAKAFNDTLSQSKGFAQFNRDAANAAKAQEDIAKKTAQTQLAEEKLVAFRAQQAAKQEAIDAKARAADEAKLKRIAAIEAREEAAAKKKAEQDQQAISNAQQLRAQQAAEANQATMLTGATNANTKATQANTLSKKQLALQEAQAKENARANALALKNQAKELNAAKGSLDQRRAALLRLQKTFDGLNEAERASPFGQRLSKVIPQLNDQVLSLEKSTGRSQRNVGNYLSTAWGGLRMIANILPGVGIAGLLGFAIDPIIEYISKLDVFNKKLSEIVLTRRMLSDVNTTGAKNAQTELVTLKALYDTAQNVSLSDEQRYKAAKKLQELYPKTFANYSIEQIELGKVDAGYKALTQSIIATARARASMDKIAENSSRQLDNDAKITEALIEYDKQRVIARTALIKMKDPANSGSARFYADEAARAEERQAEAAKIIREAKKDSLILDQRNLVLTENIVKQQKKGADIVGDLNTPKAGKKPTHDTTLKSNAEEIKASAKSIVDNEVNTYEIRFQALESYLSASSTAINEDARTKVAEAGKNSVKLANIEAERQKKLNDVQIEGQEIFNKLTKQFNEQQIKDATKQQADERQAIMNGSQEKLDIIEQYRNEAITGLNEQYANGLISEAQYNQQLYDIDAQASKDRIQVQIDALKKVIEEDKNYLAVKIGTNKQLGDDEKALAKLKMDYDNAVFKQQIDNNKKLKEARKELSSLEWQFGKELLNLGTEIGKGVYTRRLNDIEKEKNALTEKNALEISNIQSSTLSEEEKADRITVLNARLASDQAVLDQKKVQEKKRQARFEKASAIASVALSVAKSEVDALSYLSNPLTAPLYPIIAGLIGAIGAAQIATILATPIPEYKTGKGKGDNYSGPAWVGDGGMSELVIEPNGSMYVTPNTPTLTTVGKDTQVISGPAFKQMLAKPNMIQSVGGQIVDMSELVHEQRQTRKAIGKQSVNAYVETEKGRIKKTMQIDKYNSFIKRNFRR